VNASSEDEVELGTQPLEDCALLIDFADGHFAGTERHDLVAVDASDRRIAVNEERQDAQRVPLIRQIHLDPRSSNEGAFAETLRANLDRDRLLELWNDARHELGFFVLQKFSNERQPFETLASRRRFGERTKHSFDNDNSGRDELRSGVSLDAKDEPVRSFFDDRVRLHRLDRSLRGRSVERHVGTA